MRELINETNIENTIKFYQYINERRSFRDGAVYNNYEFSSLDYDFSTNYNMWEQNKNHIFKLFGNKIKVEKELDSKVICTPQIVEDMKEEFLIKEGAELNLLVRLFIESLSPQEIVKNQLEQNLDILDVKLNKGAKISRCFNQLEFNKKELKKQQDIYSVFLQSLKMTGKLVLSIDPLDFITVSVSKSGWSSCHHPNSCNGTGGLAYMNDYSSFVAYVETSEPMSAIIKDQENNSNHKIELPNKIWRQMVTINHDHSYTVQAKHYPNHSDAFGNEVTKLLTELLEKENNEKYIDDSIDLYDEDGWLQHPNEGLEGFIFYCDYTNNNMEYLTTVFREDFRTFYNLETSIMKGRTPGIEVGEEVYCACGCGRVNYTNQMYVEEASPNDEYYGSYYD